MVVNGEPFDDPEFFARDGFEAEATVGDDSLALTHVGGGVFEGSWTPSSSKAPAT